MEWRIHWRDERASKYFDANNHSANFAEFAGATGHGNRQRFRFQRYAEHDEHTFADHFWFYADAGGCAAFVCECGSVRYCDHNYGNGIQSKCAGYLQQFNGWRNGHGCERRRKSNHVYAFAYIAAVRRTVFYWRNKFAARWRRCLAATVVH